MSTKKAVAKETEAEAGEKQTESKDVFVSRQLAKPYDVTVAGEAKVEGTDYTIVDKAENEHLIFHFDEPVSASDVQVSTAIAAEAKTLSAEA